jgi:[NiFe] hydrogenase diaphorase moiety large subunit
MTTAAPDTDTLDAIVARHRPVRGALLQALREVQAAFGHVPQRAIHALSAHCGVEHGDVRAVVGFYHFLSATPQGRYVIHLSDGVTDHLLGADALCARLCARLGVVEAQTRGDGRVSVHRTSCTGLCDQGPAGLVNGQPLVDLSPARIDAIADLVNGDVPLSQWPADFFTVRNTIWRRDQTLDHPLAPGEALAALCAVDVVGGAQALFEAVRDAGLRGRGGAGFPTWRKWEACRAAPGPRVVTCNADEGEPGTFKDRLLLMEWTHAVVEGMTLTALAVGADTGVIYLRAEYAFVAPHLREILAERRRLGLLGENVCGSGRAFDVELHLGAGAYVCGEETALLESAEGKRGIPRTRPPFPVVRGFEGRPTVNNNVETFVQVAQIARHGASWFRARGTDTSPGTRILSIAGDVPRPGLYEVAWGVTIDEVLALCGATDVGAVLVGGPSGRLVPPAGFGRRLAFDDLPTGGAFTVFDRSRDLVDIARRFTQFFADESCGFCTPCRVGCVQLTSLAGRLASGRGSRRDVGRIREIGDLMQRLSHCGLGQTAPHPLLDLVRDFPTVVDARIVHDDDHAFDLAAATVDMAALDDGAASTKGEP